MKSIFTIACSIILLASCEKYESSADSISGYAQKGYLAEGSKITAVSYGKNITPTGETYLAKVTGSLGAFSINIENTDAAYFELKAEGYYFDETTGLFTDSPICLEAFVQSNDSNVNLNIFTTIIKKRIMKLISSGMSYNKAKNQAQAEYFKTTNTAGADIDFTKMDLTGGSDADAMFLFTTCRIQNGRSASEVSAILNTASEEFADSGTLSEKTSKELFQADKDLDFEVVFDNLYKYYDENGLSKDNLPSYWKYFGLPEDVTLLVRDIDKPENEFGIEGHEATSHRYKVIAIEPFNISTTVDWITFEQRKIRRDEYEVKVNIAENKTMDQRTGYLIFTDMNSEKLETKKFTQNPNARILLLEVAKPIATTPYYKSSILGQKVTVNGKDYVVESYDGEQGVKVPKVDSYRICYPAGSIGEANEYYRCVIDYPAVMYQDVTPILCGAVKESQYVPLGYINKVKMEYASEIFCYNLKGIEDFEYLTLNFSESNNMNIAGKFEYTIYEDNVFAENDWNSQIIEGDVRQIRAYDGNNDNKIMIAVPPVKYHGNIYLVARAYNKSDKLIGFSSLGYSGDSSNRRGLYIELNLQPTN